MLIDNRALSYHLHHTNPSISSVATINSSRVFIHYSSHSVAGSHSVAASIIIIEVTVRINVEDSFKGRHLFRVRDLIYVPTADL
jgi:hypothetical protein